jgi:hypothetical protein
MKINKYIFLHNVKINSPFFNKKLLEFHIFIIFLNQSQES